MQRPRISFLIPSYNQGRFLEENLLSIFGQKYEGTEILISDGGSTDETLDVIDRYKDRISWVRSGPDSGTWHANNLALAAAKGDFIWIVNSDDRLEPDAISHFLNALDANPEGLWFTGKVYALNAAGTPMATFSPQVLEPTCGLSFLTECWIYHPATIVHRSLMGSGFRDTDLLDWDLWIRLEAAGYMPILIDKVLAGLRFHEDCKSHDTIRILENQAKLLEEIQPEVISLGKTTPAEYSRFLGQAKEKIIQQKVRSLAFEGNRLKAFLESIKLANQFPDALTRRWYWGLVKRIFTGFSPDEASPLSFLNAPSPHLQ